MTDSKETSEIKRGVHTECNFSLSGGGLLPEARAAYVTLGKLNGEGTNAILIAHGFTSSHTFVEPGSTAAEGTWSDLIGPGLAIDTDRFFVVSSNALGSSYGSSGPGSINPATGTAWGPDFPAIAFEDIARLQKVMLDALGVRHLHAVAGVSMGGFQALQFGVQYPDFMDRIVVALSSINGERVAASAGGLRASLASHPAWHDGRYAPGAMNDLLTQMRMNTMHNYGMDKWLEDEGRSGEERARLIAGMGQEWAETFEPNSMLTLMHAMEQFNAAPLLDLIKARVFFMLCTSDLLFPSSLREMIELEFKRSRLNYKFHELKSPYGHLASGLDWQLWANELNGFMQEPA